MPHSIFPLESGGAGLIKYGVRGRGVPQSDARSERCKRRGPVPGGEKLALLHSKQKKIVYINSPAWHHIATIIERPGVQNKNSEDNNNVALAGVNRRDPRALRVGGAYSQAAKKSNGNNGRGPASGGEVARYALFHQYSAGTTITNQFKRERPERKSPTCAEP